MRITRQNPPMNCKAIDGLIRYLTRVIPDGVLLSIAHVRFTWFNKCKRFAGLNFKCKLEVELIIKNCQLFSGRGKLWTPRFKGDLIFRKVDLDPNHCGGHSFRYSTNGWGLIQLYFGGINNNELHRSHIGHQSEKRALTWETEHKELGLVNKWDWKEIEQAGRKLKYCLVLK